MPSRAVSLVDLVVHELRTPLTVAIGSLRQLGGLADPAQQAAVARALRSCERLEQLSGQMRDWTRLEDSPAEPGAIALSPVLAEAVRTASATRAAAVDIVVGDLPDVMVRALPHLLPTRWPRCWPRWPEPRRRRDRRGRRHGHRGRRDGRRAPDRHARGRRRRDL